MSTPTISPTNKNPITPINDGAKKKSIPTDLSKKVAKFITSSKILNFVSTLIIATTFVAVCLLPPPIAIVAAAVAAVAVLILGIAKYKILKKMEAENKKSQETVSPLVKVENKETEAQTEENKDDNDLFDKLKFKIFNGIDPNLYAVKESYEVSKKTKIKYAATAGIPNQGNSCYMAALLQAMHNCASLRNLFNPKETYTHEQCVDKIIECEEINGDNARKILKYISNLSTIDSETDKIVSYFRNISKISSNKKITFTGNDVKLFNDLKLILEIEKKQLPSKKPLKDKDSIRKELSNIMKSLSAKKQVDNINTFRHKLVDTTKKLSKTGQEDSDELFEVLNGIFNIGKHLEINHEIKTVSPSGELLSTDVNLTTLSPAIQLAPHNSSIDTLEKLLKQYCAPQEVMPSKNKECKTLKTAPLILPISIENISQVSIDIPLELTVPKELFSTSKEGVNYKLNSIVRLEDRHYTAYRRITGDKWLYCNDGSISSQMDKIPEKDLKKNSRMLFYERIDEK